MHLQPRPHNWWEFTPKNSTQNERALFQLRVLDLGLLQDGDVGVGVLPECEEVLIGRAGLGSVSLQHIGAGEAEMGEDN